MLAAFQTLLPTALLIALGYGLTRIRMMDASHWSGVERLGYFVMIPALFAQTLAEAPLSLSLVLSLGGTLVFGVVAVTAICLALRWPMERAAGIDGPAFTSVLQGAIRWNAMVALAVTGSVYGEAGVALLGIAVVALIPLINVVAVVAVVRCATPGKVGLGPILKSVLANPFILACVIGLALNLTGQPLPEPVWTTVKIMGAGALPLSLLVVGAGLDLARLARPDVATSLAVGLKFLAMPVLVVSFGVLIGLDSMTLGVAAIIASVPAPGASYVFARQMGGDAPLMARIVTLETMVALAVLPVVIWLLGIYN